MKHPLFSLIVSAAFVAAASTALAATAQENWTAKCALCHAADGTGKAKLKTRDYTSAEVQKSFSDDQALKSIKEGIKEEGKKMPAYGEKLAEQEIKDLVAHVRGLQK